jgi:hypothetical protein
MLGFYLISFEVVAIVLFGIFMRTDSSSIDNIEYFGQSSLLLLGTVVELLRLHYVFSQPRALRLEYPNQPTVYGRNRFPVEYPLLRFLDQLSQSII